MCGFFAGVHGFFGEVHGFLGGCMVFWGHAWFFRGACVVFSGGHVWFFRGACMLFRGGSVHDFFGGHAWLFQGGACVAYDEIRSISGRCASHRNAFFFIIKYYNFHSLVNRRLFEGRRPSPGLESRQVPRLQYKLHHGETRLRKGKVCFFST